MLGFDRTGFARTTAVLFALGALGCTPVVYERAAGPADCPPSAGGEQGTADELSELLAEVLAPRICEQAIGAFIGMPGEGGREGTAAGLDPSVGRWWIRQCQADVVDGRLAVAIAGSGWTWIDRETMGFRVRQYLRFDGAATFSASLHVGYDARSRTATVWLRPAPGVTAQIAPQGLVTAEATGVFSSVLGGILDMAGSGASQRARAQAAEEGSAQLRDKLQAGFTATYALDTEQMDLMLGELARGQVPERPWPSTGAAWLINERSSVWPGGMDVLGPIAEEAGPVTLDVQLEEGESAALRRVCEADLARWLDAAWNGDQGASNVPPGEPVLELNAAGQTSSVRLEPRACRTLLLVAPGPGATLPSTLRYRALRANPPPSRASAAVAYEVGAEVAPPPVRPTSVRLEIRSASIVATTPGGGSWDVIGGEPDPYVVVTSIPRRQEIARTPVVDDSREPRFDLVLPGALRLEDFPLRLSVFDEDVTRDELIGVVDVDASATEGELALPIRSEGRSPVTTGTLRIRFSPVR